jgi:hypothetical protein
MRCSRGRISLSSNNEWDELLDFLADLLASIVIEVIIRLAVLTFEAIDAWFQERANQTKIDDLAFTLKQEMKKGYTVYQGFFDQAAGTVDKTKVRKVKAKGLDAKTADLHSKSNLVIYQ